MPLPMYERTQPGMVDQSSGPVSATTVRRITRRINELRRSVPAQAIVAAPSVVEARMSTPLNAVGVKISPGGLLDISGSTSGHASIVVPAIAGTPTITLPTVSRTGLTAQPGSTLPLKVSSGGVESAAQIVLTTDVSGVLPVANGGTGSSLPGVTLRPAMQPVHVYQTNTPGNITTLTSYAVYIGRATGSISNLTILGKVTTVGAVVAGPVGLKVGICSGPLVINGNSSLTAVSFNDVHVTWAGIGTQTSAFTGLSIAAGTDLWLVVYGITNLTPWAFDLTSVDAFQTGVIATYAGDASSGTNTFTVAGVGSGVAYLIAFGIS